MKRIGWISALTLLVALPVLLHAKAPVVLIEVRHANGALQKITDSKVRQFEIWEGPGTGVSMNDGDGFIVAWKLGETEKPAGLAQYDVIFSVGCAVPSGTCPGDVATPAYAVAYAFDPSSNRGFVYLPGRSDASYEMNANSIYRGRAAEGRWFVATDAWNTFARSQFDGLVKR